MKKTISILMCFTILISTLVFTQIYISAEESTIKVSGEFKYEVIKDGTASILSYSNNHISNHGTTLKIPSTIDNYVVSTIGFSSFIADYSITSLVIPDSVKYIGGHAFRECYNLQNVTMGNSIEIIYSHAFSKCSSITSITIPNSVKTIRDGAFGGCTNLKSVNYIGTEEEWKKIDIEEANKYLINAEFEFTPSTSTEQTQPSTQPEQSTQPSTQPTTGLDNSTTTATGLDNSATTTTGLDNSATTTTGLDNSATTTTGLDNSTTTTTSSDDSVHKCNPVLVAKVEPTVDSEGKQAYYKCDCGKYYEDAFGLVEIADIVTYGIISKIDSTTPSETETSMTETSETETSETTPSTQATQPATKAEQPTNPTVNPTKPTTPIVKPTPTKPVVAKQTLSTPKVKFTAGKKQIKIKYTKVKNAVGFQVRYRIKGKWKYKNFTTKKSSTKTIKKLKKGKYKIQIRSFTKGKKQFSKWTKVKTVKVK